MTSSSARIRYELLLSEADVIVPGHFSQLFRRNGRWLWDEAPSLELLVR